MPILRVEELEQRQLSSGVRLSLQPSAPRFDSGIPARVAERSPALDFGGARTVWVIPIRSADVPPALGPFRSAGFVRPPPAPFSGVVVQSVVSVGKAGAGPEIASGPDAPAVTSADVSRGPRE